MKCLSCGKGELTHKKSNLPYTYKNQTTVIHNVMGDYCNHCNEIVMDYAESTRVSEEMLKFNKTINASTVDPSFIASVRKKLKLNQQQAAEVFGGGINAFSRYEKGVTNPPLALIKLFTLLDNHPDLLSEIIENSMFKQVSQKKVSIRVPAAKTIKPKSKKPLLNVKAIKKSAKITTKRKAEARKKA